MWTRFGGAAVNAGAVEVSPLAEVPWGGRCGKLVDPFGHYWSISGEASEAENENVPRQSAQRTRAANRNHM